MCVNKHFYHVKSWTHVIILYKGRKNSIKNRTYSFCELDVGLFIAAVCCWLRWITGKISKGFSPNKNDTTEYLCKELSCLISSLCPYTKYESHAMFKKSCMLIYDFHSIRILFRTWQLCYFRLDYKLVRDSSKFDNLIKSF